MTVTSSQRRGGGYLERPAPSGLADVIEIILDKGIVIDAYAGSRWSGSSSSRSTHGS